MVSGFRRLYLMAGGAAFNISISRGCGPRHALLQHNVVQLRRRTLINKAKQGEKYAASSGKAEKNREGPETQAAPIIRGMRVEGDRQAAHNLTPSTLAEFVTLKR